MLIDGGWLIDGVVLRKGVERVYVGGGGKMVFYIFERKNDGLVEWME